MIRYKPSYRGVSLKRCNVVPHAAPVDAVNHTEGPWAMKDSSGRIEFLYLDKKKKDFDAMEEMLGKAAQAREMIVLVPLGSTRCNQSGRRIVDCSMSCPNDLPALAGLNSEAIRAERR